MDGQYTPILFQFWYGEDDHIEYYLCRELTASEKKIIWDIIKSDSEDFITDKTESRILDYLDSLEIEILDDPVIYEIGIYNKTFTEY